jgi:hypothetical protein
LEVGLIGAALSISTYRRGDSLVLGEDGATP